ncbi:MAG TPA: amidase family protein [Mobilitalea sp.]|nr:amidase family protein [Mobilitalea sp.]
MINIREITISEIQKLLSTKSITVKELVHEYIDRIYTLDKGEEGLNSVLEINPEALRIAENLDIQGNKEGKPLYGVPILIKDNIATADLMHTSAGSIALADSYVSYDADIIKTLRKNGAVILGKTNMTELANYVTKNMPAGYSPRGGQVLNPYDREKDPSGSSTGSAVAVAANLCAASIGTDTSNSIIAPALSNGIVGLRPTTGVISQQGIIPISFSLDTAGPFTRTVEDAAIMYAGLTDTAIIHEDSTDLKGKIIGYNEWMPDAMPEETIVRMEEVVRSLEKAGATIKRVTIPKTIHIKNLMKYEFKYAMNQYLKSLPKDYHIKTLKDIIEFNKQHSKDALQYGQTYLLDAEENTSGNCDEVLYRETLKDREECIRSLREQLQGMDLCIMLSFNNILQYTAMPVITIPCGLYKDGMPFGIYMTANNDRQLIKNALIVSKIAGLRVEPRL